MGTPEYENETRMGEWVAARCRKRAEEHHIPMPEEVEQWLKYGGKSPVDGDTDPPPFVLVWVFKTIDDPDWPSN